MLFSCSECYCHRCVIDGVWKWEYTSLASCDECVRTYECHEVVQAECDGECPSGYQPIGGSFWSPYIEIKTREDCYSSFYPATYYARADVVIGCGSILSANITYDFGTLAKTGRVAPTVTAVVYSSQGTGAVLSVVLGEFIDNCGLKAWRVDAVNVIAGGSGYSGEWWNTDGVEFQASAGDSTESFGYGYIQTDENGTIVNVFVYWAGKYYREDPNAPPIVLAPEISFIGALGSGAVIVPVVDTNPSSPTYGKITALTVQNGGSGYHPQCSRTRSVASCDDCPPRTAPESSSCTQISAVGTCGTWACGSCCRCYQISASGFSVSDGCYILTDLTEHVDALGDWPMFPGDGCTYYRGVFDSEGVLHEFSASLSMPWPDGGTATLTVTLKVDGVTVASWTYEKEVGGPWYAPVTFAYGDITSQTGDVCSGGAFEVSPCRCKCAKLGGVLPKDPGAYGIYKGRGRVNDPPLNGNGTYWIAEVNNGQWTGGWICVDPWTVAGLAAGDVYPMSGWFCDLCGYTPEVSGVPSLPVTSCRCGEGVTSSEKCGWTATLETDHYGNKVPFPSLQSGDGPCEENPLP